MLSTSTSKVGVSLGTASSKLASDVAEAGGVKVTFATPSKNLDEKLLYTILKDYKILNADVLVRDENGMVAPLTMRMSLADML